MHQGRQPGVGLDCAGLIIHVVKTLGLEYTDLAGYPRTPFEGMLKAHLDGQPCLERINSLEPNCVLLMRIKRDPQHLALWTGEKMIHAYLTAGKVVEHGMDDRWKKLIVAIYRIKADE